MTIYLPPQKHIFLFFFPRVKKNRPHIFMNLPFFLTFLSKISRNLIIPSKSWILAHIPLIFGGYSFENQKEPFRQLFCLYLDLCFFFTLQSRGKRKNNKMSSYLPLVTDDRRNYMLLQEKEEIIPLCWGTLIFN